MAPADIDVVTLLSEIKRLPRNQQARALANMPADQKEALHSSAAKRKHELSQNCPLFADILSKPGISTVDKNMFLEYAEHLHFDLSIPTKVDRMFEAAARKNAPSSTLSIQECRQNVYVLSANIFKSWKALNDIHTSRGEVIRQQWLRNSRKNKKAMLLAAWPGMPSRHRPDMASDRSEEASMWPYINLEDLSSSEALYSFLESRGRNLPDKFAYSDLELAPLFKRRKEFLNTWPGNFTMTFIGQTTGQTYGNLVEHPDVQAAFGAIKQGRPVHIDHGLQILLLQQRIFSFLLHCANLILEQASDRKTQPVDPALAEIESPLDLGNIIA
jgi:hypothetical protein